MSATLDAADVLVITSDNEGVTLTSFEADAHDALVISADVGSQRSVVVDDPDCRLLVSSRHYGDEDPMRTAALIMRTNPSEVGLLTFDQRWPRVSPGAIVVPRPGGRAAPSRYSLGRLRQQS